MVTKKADGFVGLAGNIFGMNEEMVPWWKPLFNYLPRHWVQPLYDYDEYRGKFVFCIGRFYDGMYPYKQSMYQPLGFKGKVHLKKGEVA